MKQCVLKFGGSSVVDFTKIKNIAEMLRHRADDGEQFTIVISAMGKTTDQLMESVSHLTTISEDRELALLLTTGKRQAVSCLLMILSNVGVSARTMTRHQADIETVGHHLKSRVAGINPEIFNKESKDKNVLVVVGFQGVNDELELAMPSRGSSDTTAAALVASNQVPCEIYTSVDGIYATNPRILSKAKRLDYVSYEEMMEINALGAGVLKARSAEPARNYNIPLCLGRTLSNVKGTWIMSRIEILGKKAVTEVALDTYMIYVTASYPLPDNRLLTQLFTALDEGSVSVDIISQIVSVKGLQSSFSTKDSGIQQISGISEGLSTVFDALDYRINKAYVEISLTGSRVRNMPGVVSRTFIMLISSNVPFCQTATFEINISHITDAEDGDKAVEVLYDVFDI